MSSARLLILIAAVAAAGACMPDLSGLDAIGEFGEAWAESVTDHGPGLGGGLRATARTTSVEFDIDTLHLQVGDSTSVTVRLEDGHPLWVSSDPGVAVARVASPDAAHIEIRAKQPGVTSIFGKGIMLTTVRHTDTLTVVVTGAPESPPTEPSACDIEPPQPLLAHVGHTDDTGADGNPYRYYRLSVVNRDQFPNELFEHTSAFGSCGQNESPSRTWVEIFGASGERLYGFCALSSSDELGDLWFALPRREAPPDVYVELRDRSCGRTYVSNVVSVESSESGE